MTLLTSLQAWDTLLLRSVQDALGGPGFDHFLPLFSSHALLGALLALHMLALVALAGKRAVPFVMASVLAALITMGLTDGILKPVFARTRPPNALGVRDDSPSQAPATLQRSATGVRLAGRLPSNASFPSGHTSTSFAALLPLLLGFLRHRQRHPPHSVLAGAGVLTASLSAGLAGLSRVYIGVHWPGDVLAGAVLGGAVGWALTTAASRLARPRQNEG